MRIAIIGSRGIESNYGGIETALAEICPRLAARGHDVVVYSERPDSGRNKCIIKDGVRIVRMPALSGKYTETISRSLLATIHAQHREHDVINFTAMGPGILSALSTCLQTPTVVSMHGLDWQRGKWPGFAKMALRWAERVAVRCADRITVDSKSQARYFEREYNRKVDYIPNGISNVVPKVDLDPLADMDLEPEEYVLFVGRLVPEKGVHELIEAFNGIETSKKLVIAGEARNDRAYPARLRSLADPGKIRFMGHVQGEALQALFAGAYLFVLPSQVEGMSLSLLEALGHRKAVLVSRIPENLDVLGDQGVTFRVGDVGDLRATLARLLADPDEVKHVACRITTEFVHQFNWDTLAERFEQVYGEAVLCRRRIDPTGRPVRF